jgi:hypothetical protein
MEYSSLMSDLTINEVSLEETCYEVVKGGSKRGKDLLVDSLGHCYNVKRSLKGSTHWQCSHRPPGDRCSAIIIQHISSSTFKTGRQHNHSGTIGVDVAVKTAKRIKDLASTNLFKPASAIVDEVRFS